MSRTHPSDKTLLQPSKNFVANTGIGHQTIAFPPFFADFLKRNGRDVTKTLHMSRMQLRSSRDYIKSKSDFYWQLQCVSFLTSPRAVTSGSLRRHFRLRGHFRGLGSNFRSRGHFRGLGSSLEDRSRDRLTSKI